MQFKACYYHVIDPFFIKKFQIYIYNFKNIFDINVTFSLNYPLPKFKMEKIIESILDGMVFSHTTRHLLLFR